MLTAAEARARMPQTRLKEFLEFLNERVRAFADEGKTSLVADPGIVPPGTKAELERLGYEVIEERSGGRATAFTVSWA